MVEKWTLSVCLHTDRPEIRDAKGRLIAVVRKDYPMSEKTRTNNARLIATAPELLEIVEMVARSGFTLSHDDIAKAREVLSKARGERE